MRYSIPSLSPCLIHIAVARLRDICGAEGMFVSIDALRHLAALTDNDVRSCLNTLQYLKAQVAVAAAAHHGAAATSYYGLGPGGAVGSDALRGRLRVTSDMIARAAVGVKDQTKALHGVWASVFSQADTRQRSTAALRGLGMGVGDGSGSDMGFDASEAADAALVSSLSFSTAAARARASYFGTLHNTLSSYSSEPRLLLAGLHENLLTENRNADPTMTHTVRALDWLCFGAEIAGKSNSAAGGLHKYTALAGEWSGGSGGRGEAHWMHQTAVPLDQTTPQTLRPP